MTPVRLLSLSLQQFRNYSEAVLQCADADFHVFVGSNGSGKTNILESIAYLSSGDSCRDALDEDVVQWGRSFFRVEGEIEGGVEESIRVLEVVHEQTPRRRKALFTNDVRTPPSDFSGQLPVVAFLPEALDLFAGAPRQRRKFLDSLLCQVSPEYVQSLSRYQHLLKQRGALLKRIGDGRANLSELDPWDLALARETQVITGARLKLVETLNLTLEDEVRTLGLEWSEVLLHYIREGQEGDSGMYPDEFISLLRAVRQRDVILQATTVGPHRDDWNMTISGRSLPSFASRGQQRLCFIALLFLEVAYLELCRGEKPVVLLDDVFSELDVRHQACLMDSLMECQVFLSALSLPSIFCRKKGRVWEVREGQVNPVPAFVSAV